MSSETPKKLDDEDPVNLSKLREALEAEFQFRENEKLAAKD